MRRVMVFGRCVMRRYECERCGDVMLVTYRKDPKSDVWQWVRLCPTCRHVARMLDKDLPLAWTKES